MAVIFNLVVVFNAGLAGQSRISSHSKRRFGLCRHIFIRFLQFALLLIVKLSTQLFFLRKEYLIAMLDAHQRLIASYSATAGLKVQCEAHMLGISCALLSVSVSGLMFQKYPLKPFAESSAAGQWLARLTDSLVAISSIPLRQVAMMCRTLTSSGNSLDVLETKAEQLPGTFAFFLCTLG